MHFFNHRGREGDLFNLLSPSSVVKKMHLRNNALEKRMRENKKIGGLFKWRPYRQKCEGNVKMYAILSKNAKEEMPKAGLEPTTSALRMHCFPTCAT